MPSQSQVQALLDTRSTLYGQEFTKLSSEGLASWHVETTQFSDIGEFISLLQPNTDFRSIGRIQDGSIESTLFLQQDISYD